MAFGFLEVVAISTLDGANMGPSKVGPEDWEVSAQV